MKVKAEYLKVSPALSAKGERLEPEELPMNHVRVVDFAANTQAGQNVGAMKGEVITETTVGEMAAVMRNPCFSCKHWNAEAWKKLFSRWNNPGSTLEERRYLNDIRAQLLESQNASLNEEHAGQDGDIDVEHALSGFGVCEPISEVIDGPMITYMKARCPQQFCTPAQPDGFYKAKDRDSERASSLVFDRIMRMATT